MIDELKAIFYSAEEDIVQKEWFNSETIHCLLSHIDWSTLEKVTLKDTIHLTQIIEFLTQSCIILVWMR